MGNGQHRFLLLYVCSLITHRTNGGHPAAPKIIPGKNLAVYEGKLDTLIYFPSTPKGVNWMIYPASDSKRNWFDIVNYDDVVNAKYKADFDFSPTVGLTIKNATTEVHPGHQISTAGSYIADADRFDNKIMCFKLLVVQSGPVCLCFQDISSIEIQLSCSVTYADSSEYPIFPNLTWIVNGALYATDQPNRIMTDREGLYSATSNITVDDGTLENYQCMLTFGEPMNIYYGDCAARNAPEFNESCSTPVCSNISNESTTIVQSTMTTSYCLPNLRNIGVHEGQLDVLLNVTSTPCSVSWLVYPTTDDMDGVPIVGSDCTQDSSLASLYNVIGSGLIIRNSTTDNIGRPISTSGLYVAQCNDNGLQVGLKFVVVRSGPDCSCEPDDSSSSVRLSCSVSFADHPVHYIPIIFTWMKNEEKYATDEPYRNMTDSFTFTATSIIEVDGRTPDVYQCTVTFGEPRDIQYDYIATNAPDFEESCSAPRC